MSDSTEAPAGLLSKVSLGTWITLATMTFGGGATYATISMQSAAQTNEIVNLRQAMATGKLERQAEDTNIKAELKELRTSYVIIQDRVREQQTAVIERLVRVETSLQTLIALIQENKRAAITPYRKTSSSAE